MGWMLFCLSQSLLLPSRCAGAVGLLHVLLGLWLQEAHKPTVTHAKPGLRGGGSVQMLLPGKPVEKNKEVTSDCPPASFLLSSHKCVS